MNHGWINEDDVTEKLNEVTLFPNRPSCGGDWFKALGMLCAGIDMQEPSSHQVGNVHESIHTWVSTRGLVT